MHTKEKTRNEQRVRHAQDKAEEMFQQSWRSLQEKSSDFQEDVVMYIRDNPIKAMGIATLAGMVLSRLLRK